MPRRSQPGYGDWSTSSLGGSGSNSEASSSASAPDTRKTNSAPALPSTAARTDVVELVGVLVRETKMRREFARFRKQRRERVGAEGLKLVDVDEERHPVLGCLVATRHGDELQVREQQRAEKIRRLLPYLSLGQVRDEDAAMVHRMGKVEFRRYWPENVAQRRRGGELANLVENGARRLGAIALVVARDTPLSRNGRCIGSLMRATMRDAKFFVGIEPRQVDERRPRALKESGDAVKKKMLKARSPTLAPQVFERRDYAGGGERMALARHTSQRIEADRTLRVAQLEVAHLVCSLGRDGIDDRFGKVAVRVDDGDPFPSHDVVHGEVEQVVLFPEPDLPTI